jgi:ubiquinone/menaquinone biosynthesis C-methylase UbiE
MSNPLTLYGNMLTAQSRLQFPFERFLYAQREWRDAAAVVDFGCGNASYLNLLHREFPEKEYYGVEANAEMLDLARTGHGDHKFRFYRSTTEIGDQQIDFVLMRYVVMHLDDRQSVFSELARVLKPDAFVLVIEPDDDKIFITPSLPLLDEAILRIKSASKNRDLRNRLAGEFSIAGFSLVNEAGCVISNSIDQVEKEILKYVHALIEIGLQQQVSMEQKASLLDWYLNPQRFVQFGFYAQLYGRSKLEF